MKNNIRDTNNKELQEIIANTILLPDISNLDCLHEPITASFGLLLLYAQLYHYSENKERLFSKIVDIINAIRPLASLYAQNRNIGLFGGLCDFGISLLAINKETGTYHMRNSYLRWEIRWNGIQTLHYAIPTGPL